MPYFKEEGAWQDMIIILRIMKQFVSVEWSVNFMMYELRGLPFRRDCIIMRWLVMMTAVVIR